MVTLTLAPISPSLGASIPTGRIRRPVRPREGTSHLAFPFLLGAATPAQIIAVCPAVANPCASRVFSTALRVYRGRPRVREGPALAWLKHGENADGDRGGQVRSAPGRPTGRAVVPQDVTEQGRGMFNPHGFCIRGARYASDIQRALARGRGMGKLRV